MNEKKPTQLPGPHPFAFKAKRVQAYAPSGELLADIWNFGAALQIELTPAALQQSQLYTYDGEGHSLIINFPITFDAYEEHKPSMFLLGLVSGIVMTVIPFCLVIASAS